GRVDDLRQTAQDDPAAPGGSGLAAGACKLGDPQDILWWLPAVSPVGECDRDLLRPGRAGNEDLILPHVRQAQVPAVLHTVVGAHHSRFGAVAGIGIPVDPPA
ncbi:ParB/Sulfiredoxin domain-containing protein, partial [Dysosmobacter welbionis]